MSSDGEAILRDNNSYQHALQLECAYDEQMMPYTNYTLDFKGMIDYVFASTPLQRLSVLLPISQDWSALPFDALLRMFNAFF